MRKYELAVNNYLPKGSSTIPDFYVAPTIKDYLNKHDTELEFALNLIGKNKKPAQLKK